MSRLRSARRNDLARRSRRPGRSYDLHPDGDRFLVIDTPRERTADRIYVIKNWVEEMKRQVGG